MSDEQFRDPNLSLHRIYTRSGDAGDTRLVNGRRVRKDDPKVEAYGTVDELIALVGRARESLRATKSDDVALAPLGDTLLRVQHELFNLGSEIATDPGSLGPQQPRTVVAQVERLEAEIDAINADLRPLKSFVLPGGSALNADLHVCRTVCRRAERALVSLAASESGLDLPLRYLNRLSDALFVWSRWVCLRSGDPETLWQPNRGT